MRTSRDTTEDLSRYGRLSLIFPSLVGSFVHNMAALRNHAQGCLYSLREEGEQLTPRDAEDFLRSITHLTIEFHEFYKLVNELFDREHEPFRKVTPAQLKDLLRNCLDLPSDYVDFRVRVAPIPDEYSLPERLIRFLVSPLIDNAYEAIEERKANKKALITISASTLHAGEGFRLVVSDSGPGWGKHLDKIREGVRKGDVVSSKGPDRGWGLSHVYSLVKCLGGQLSLDNTKQGGARVEIRID